MRKKAEQTQLTARERAFVERLVDFTDHRSVGAKGQACGWSDRKHGYRVAKRPLVAQEIQRRVDESLRLQRARALAVLDALADRALEGDNVAARTYLEGVGMISRNGATVVTAVNTGANTSGFLSGESLEDRIRRIAETDTDEGRAVRIERVRDARVLRARLLEREDTSDA